MRDEKYSSHPDGSHTSVSSVYNHFGGLSPQEIADRVTREHVSCVVEAIRDYHLRHPYENVATD